MFKFRLICGPNICAQAEPKQVRKVCGISMYVYVYLYGVRDEDQAYECSCAIVRVNTCGAY